MTHPNANPGAGKDAHPASQDPIAGRIEAQPSELAGTVDAWVSRLVALKKAPSTVAIYRYLVTAAIKETGWSRNDDLTQKNIQGYMDQKAHAGIWAGATYKRNLKTFRSLTKFIAGEHSVRDSLEHAMAPADDGGEGPRAATTDEARMMIQIAWARAMVDDRCRCPRDLIRFMDFLMGLRPGEYAKLEWTRHLLLDEPVPILHWTRDINKNRREQDVVIPRELVPHLLAHRDRMRELAKTMPVYQPPTRRGAQPAPRVVSPDEPGGKVFPILEGKQTWDQDAARAGIPKHDRRGRPFTRRSARKWFDTQLVMAQVHPDVIRWLMRHRGATPDRYFDPPMMLDALSKLPRLWPENAPIKNVDNPGLIPDHLTAAGKVAQNVTANPVHRRQESTVSVPKPFAGESGWHSTPAWAGTGIGFGTSVMAAPSRSGEQEVPVIEAHSICNSGGRI